MTPEEQVQWLQEGRVYAERLYRRIHKKDWANCAVPDCCWKATGGSDKCYPHTFGLTPDTEQDYYFDSDGNPREGK